MLYPNLKAEMARQNIKDKDLVKVLKRSPQTISYKMNGKNKEKGFTLDEAEKIKVFLGVEMPIDELFARGE